MVKLKLRLGWQQSFLSQWALTWMALPGRCTVLDASNTKKRCYTCFRFTCPQLNISECAISEENDQFVVLVQNSLARDQNVVVRLPVQGSKEVTVTDSDGNSVPSTQVDIPNEVLQTPGRKVSGTSEVVFFATDLSPMGRIKTSL